jgi:E3 ubiquitin-protein ligase RAD18
MRKDFDGNAYSRRHQDDFSRLIADAKRKKNIAPSASQSEKSKEHGHAGEEATTNGDGKSPFFDESSPLLIADEQDTNGSRSAPIEANRRPYENDPEALSNLQEKVQAINEGRTPTPVLNQGFQNPEVEIAANPDERRTSERPEPPTMFNNPIEPVSNEADPRRHESVPTETADRMTLDTELGLSSHVLSSQPKRMPMFAMPEQPVTDVELDAK